MIRCDARNMSGAIVGDSVGLQNDPRHVAMSAMCQRRLLMVLSVFRITDDTLRCPQRARDGCGLLCWPSKGFTTRCGARNVSEIIVCDYGHLQNDPRHVAMLAMYQG